MSDASITIEHEILNKYNYPNKEVLDNLKDSKINRTDEDGSIMFKIKNNELKIETCNP